MPAPVEFQNLLDPRFLWVLQAVLRDQVWVQSDGAMSVLEVCICFFVQQTRWLSPQGPPSLAKCECASFLLTEVDYPSLSVCREPLGKQATTFYHAMKFLAKCHGIEFQFGRSKSLAVYGCHEMVPSLSLVPLCLRPAGQSPTVFDQIRSLWSVQQLTCPHKMCRTILVKVVGLVAVLTQANS